jgi:hypothetical protein
LEEWLAASDLPTLGQLIIRGEVGTNPLFTHYSNYYFKGLSKVSAALNGGSANAPMAEAYYRSHFLAQGVVEEAGGPAAFASAALDEAAESPAWREAEKQRRQLDLFR